MSAAGGVRDVAIDALVRVEGGAFANLALPALLRRARLDARERARCTDLVYGTIRRRRALDHLLAPCLDRPLGELEPPVRAALRLGAAQLVGGTPPHAAVGETVAAVGRVRPRAKGLVNAVLRRVAALGPPWPWPEGDDLTARAVRASVPDWVVQRLDEDLGRRDADAVLATVNEPAEVTLRVNRRRASVDVVARELEAAGASVTRGALMPDALRVRTAGDLRALPAIAEGRATPQDEASQAVVGAVGAEPGERIVEIGAAPGGKASALAETIDDRGLVVALDRHPGRTRLIAEAATRLGLHALAPVVGDGACPPLRDAHADRVLLDAPCTGLGVLRRRPEARWRIEPGDVEDLAGLQRRLATAAADLVRPGCRFVYSVCTLTAAETIGVDAFLADCRPDLVAERPPGPPWRAHGRGALLLPAAAGTDGMFVAVYRRADR